MNQLWNELVDLLSIVIQLSKQDLKITSDFDSTKAINKYADKILFIKIRIKRNEHEYGCVCVWKDSRLRRTTEQNKIKNKCEEEKEKKNFKSSDSAFVVFAVHINTAGMMRTTVQFL